MSLYGGINRGVVDAITSKPMTTPAARAWFVDGTNGSDSNVGDKDAPFASIGQAITSAGATRGDLVIIAPGTYTITSALVPLANMSFIAGLQNNPRRPSVTITGNIADLVQIDVSGTHWQGIEFKASGSTADNLVDIADGAAVAGVSFVNCVFHGGDQTSVVGIQADDATYAVTDMYIVGCLFRDLTGTHIDIGVLGMAYSYIAKNQFAIDVNSGTAIALADTTAFATGKGYVIEENDFTGLDATANEVGITIAGTENTTGAGIIRNNYFAYLAAAAITIDKLSLSEVNNYYGDASAGGVLVDSGT